MKPRMIDGPSDLVGDFDHFILDQFGVLHDGQRPYPGAVEALQRLHAAGKAVLLLSNSGKRAAPNEARLRRLGFTAGSWNHFLSSGELAWQRLSESLGPGAPRRGLLIARDGDRSAVEGLPISLTESGEEAELILLTASEGDRHELDHYRALLAPAAARGVPCLCTNPDKVMLTPAGPRFGAGRIAELYEALGGPVSWIGKPFPEIYRAALDLLGRPDPARVICIGDSVEHDIRGGAGAGLATGLVTTGILADLPPPRREALFAEHGVWPDAILPAFRW